MRRATPAVGAFSRKDKNCEHPQIVIRFDRETFDQIAAIARRNEWSFAAVTRLLVEWGLEDMDHMDQSTPLLPLFTEGERRELAAARKGKG